MSYPFLQLIPDFLNFSYGYIADVEDAEEHAADPDAPADDPDVPADDDVMNYMLTGDYPTEEENDGNVTLSSPGGIQAESRAVLDV